MPFTETSPVTNKRLFIETSVVKLLVAIPPIIADGGIDAT